MREKIIGSIIIIMKISFPQFQLWNRKDLILTGGSIKSLSSREKNVGIIRISI